MKNYVFFIFTLLFCFGKLGAQVTIGADVAPQPFSVLELMGQYETGIYGGFRLPQLSTVDRDDITGLLIVPEAEGLMIFNTTTKCIEYWNGTTWISLCSSTVSGSPFTIYLTSSSTENQTVCIDAALTPITFATTGATYATVDGLPTGVTGSFVSNEVIISGTPIEAGNFVYEVILTNGTINESAATGTITVNLDIAPGQLGPITGPTFICQQTSEMYSVPLVAGVIYDWILPSGWTITSGANSNSITVSIASNTQTIVQDLEISVATCSSNGCCSAVQTLSVRQAVSIFPGGCSVCSSTSPTGWLTFLCYNLGADPSYNTVTTQMAYTSSGNDDATVYGDLYQWGRTTDGHQLRDPAPATVGGPLSGFNLDANGQPAGTNVGKFIATNSPPYDWRFPQDSTLWANSMVNNPCPAGYRIPTQTEWGSIFCGDPIYGYYTMATLYNTWSWNDVGTPGYMITPVGNNNATLFLPTGGYRNYSNGSQNYAGSNGIYWCSGVDGTNAHALNFYKNIVDTGSYDFRAQGFSVRCIAEY